MRCHERRERITNVKKLLLQSILKFSDSIKSGTAKVQDVVEDYFKSSGKQVTEEDRAIIMNEFAKDAPSGIEAKGVEKFSWRY